MPDYPKGHPLLNINIMNHFFMHAPKWRTGAGVLTLLVWLASCGPNNKTVEYP